MFAGLQLKSATPNIGADRHAQLNIAVQRFARATADINRMYEAGHKELPHQRVAYDAAAKALNQIAPDAARDLHSAFGRDRSLVAEAGKGRTALAIQAMALEREIRRDPALRADRFVEDWQRHFGTHRRTVQARDTAAERRAADTLAEMAKSLERDPQLESLLRNRTKQLGIDIGFERSVSQSILDWLGRSRDRGLGI
jgi:hypothetical protein